jgi:hypothetical protein
LTWSRVKQQEQDAACSLINERAERESGEERGIKGEERRARGKKTKSEKGRKARHFKAFNQDQACVGIGRTQHSDLQKPPHVTPHNIKQHHRRADNTYLHNNQ